jgi:ATP-dependent DNA helicase DinG
VFVSQASAAEADVVVVNHHLLASDLAVRLASDNCLDAAVLPPYRRLILDEAHHLEDVAARHLGAQVSMQGVYRLLGRLERNGRGLLPTLAVELAAREDLLGVASRELIHRGLLDALAASRRGAEQVFSALDRRLDHSDATAGGLPVLRLTDAFEADAVWADGLDVAYDNLQVAFGRLRDGVETIADRLALDDPGDRRAQLVGELRADPLSTRRPRRRRALRPAPGATTVRWLERRGRRTPASPPRSRSIWRRS